MTLEALRRAYEPMIRRVLHFYWRFARPMTLGVRAAVFDAQGRVFLVQHSYVDGWHLPGGGVEAGETITTSLARELSEEGNIEITDTPRLHGVFFNPSASRRDHVLVYVMREFRQSAPPQPNREIVGHGFFAPDALPEGTTRATRERLNEILHQKPPTEFW